MTRSIVVNIMPKSFANDASTILSEKPKKVVNKDCYRNVLELVFDNCPELRKVKKIF